MRKNEFIAKLREYLSFELPERLVTKQVTFYTEYISQEVRSGKTEAQVLEELGDPQLIARTVIDAAKSGSDGVPGTTDDVNFQEEIYGNPQNAGTSGGQKGYKDPGERSGGSFGSGNFGENRMNERPRQAVNDPPPRNNPARNGNFSIKGREMGCGGCLIGLLVGGGILSLLLSFLNMLDPSFVLILLLILGGAMLFRRR